ncbi:MAG: valine--tRNA ligase [Mediterranea sp.]|jgi:valyl-tRNA synthetase|nr:valine--tRNA ligase [Mediterranea sp.]
MELASKYNPADVEGKWYAYWMHFKLFSSKPDSREPYTVVIPPPNVTGVLHMGHMLNNTIQDILIRRARMEGKNACWVPGTDHASIATEAKVVDKLAARGIRKTDLSREEFLDHAWEWTHEHGDIILRQLRRLGASCDWDRTAFTMDEIRSKSVLKVFNDLHEKGLIYRGVRMVNWDPKALTAVSDEEVIYKEEHGKLYYLRYKVEGEDTYAVVATTRPETIMGDVAMCINPGDPKNRHLKGKKVIVPLINRVIPVIEDEYVDIEFGTGCLKVTPAHDVNDYMLGEKHKLPVIDIFNDDGSISEAGRLYVGMDRFDVRWQIVVDLAANGLIEKEEPYTNKVGYSERTNVIIEPKLSMQWFLKMEHLAETALKPVMDDELKFYPPKYKNTYRHWMENIKDWNISRQLWWGHRIPVWYLPQGGYVVAMNEGEALEKAKAKTDNPNLTLNDIRQDEDCLDTWFSSWLWPISLFNGILDPGNEEITYYYPTADLVTGPDIIFFWVARMIMAGYKYENDMPFRNVYFTGIVRDKQGRKMSKQLGNSPDPLELIDRYGADGVRMGMMLSAPAGNDILFDDALCEQGRNFNNKIWNAFRLIKGWKVSNDAQLSAAANLAARCFDSIQNRAALEVADLLGKYRLSEALMVLYKLFWDEFSSWYLEIIKPAYGQSIDGSIHNSTICFLDNLLKLLHPFMPFITEEIWQQMYPRDEGESIMTQFLDMDTYVDEELVSMFEESKEVIGHIRNIRLQKNIARKEPLKLQVVGRNPLVELAPVIIKMCNLSAITVVEAKAGDAASFMVGTTEYAVPLGGKIDAEVEIARMEAELKHKEEFLQGVLKKLRNEKFVSNVPASVLEAERRKQADAESIIDSLKENIAALRKA